MTDILVTLRRKIDGAQELASVVRTMKALAASNIGQYEAAVRSLDGYYRSVELGLLACFRQQAAQVKLAPAEPARITGAIVFGADQGLAGRFNEVLIQFVVAKLAALPDTKRIWAVGERVHAQLVDAQLPVVACLPMPASVQSITPLVTRLLLESVLSQAPAAVGQLFVFRNQPCSGIAYAPVRQRLLPLDAAWQSDIMAKAWPTHFPPQVLGEPQSTLLALLHEYLFVSLFKACAESLAAENASRLAAMQRAEKNIDELIGELRRTYHRERQESIDEELFELVAGFESLS
jgi:F-type H+-transporting ATPase subunit gamma